MKFPILNPGAASRDYTQEFRGYNHNLRIADGEFFDEENMSSDNYPVLTQRRKRIERDCAYEHEITGSAYYPTVKGIIRKDGFYYVSNNKLYREGTAGAVWDFSGVTDPSVYPVTLRRHLVSMGAYLCIFPDGLYYNTVDPEDNGAMSYTNTSESAYSIETLNENPDELPTLYGIRLTLGEMDGDTFVLAAPEAQPIPSGKKKPTSPENGSKFLLRDANNNIEGLFVYSSESGEWAQIKTAVAIAAPNIGTNVKEGDSIKISLIEMHASPQASEQQSLHYDSYIEEDYVSEHSEKNYPGFFNQYHVVRKVESNNSRIVIDGIIGNNVSFMGAWDRGGTGAASGYRLTVKNEAPKMDFVCESNNRLWGCRYGENNKGDFVNEIYASKLGDFRNWNYFAGTSMDSYVASCGTDGAFTGAISYLGYPLFFKENFLHKVYGNMPANYQIQQIACRGVLKGAGASLAIVEERLYYKSRAGVCVYDGSLPMEISAPLGMVLYNGTEGTDELWNGAVAGADDNKYYISMKERGVSGAWHLFVYDTTLGIWHREDNLHVDAFCYSGGTLYYIDGANRHLCYYGGDDENIEWSVTTGDLGLGSPDKKYVTRVSFRMALEIGAFVEVSIQYDNGGQYEHITTVYGSNLQTFSVPVRPKRCDHFRIKLDGHGLCKLYSISKTVEQGSDR